MRMKLIKKKSYLWKLNYFLLLFIHVKQLDDDEDVILSRLSILYILVHCNLLFA